VEPQLNRQPRFQRRLTNGRAGLAVLTLSLVAAWSCSVDSRDVYLAQAGSDGGGTSGASSNGGGGADSGGTSGALGDGGADSGGGSDSSGASGASGEGGEPAAAGSGDCPFSGLKPAGGCQPKCGTQFHVADYIIALDGHFAQYAMGLSEHGDILYLANGSECGGPNHVYLARKVGSEYKQQELTGDPDLAGMALDHMYLGVDGQLLVTAKADHSAFMMGAITANDVSAFSPGPFAANINSLYTSEAVRSLDFPTLSGDRLTLTFCASRMADPLDANCTIFQSTRSNASAPFDPPVQLALGSAFLHISALSFDGLVAFVDKNDYQNYVFTRANVAASFRLASLAPITLPNLYTGGVKVAGNCSTLIATSGPGGCQYGKLTRIEAD